ncbi:MAG TPA: YdeI/OmpD-associated family protein [Parafilimonas sp.]|nr:YdeI/OmpD-associated family protein [Parafilimonas sp.]
MEFHNDVKTLHAKTRKEWRKWLEKNSQTEKSVWLIIYHKGSITKSVYYEEAVEEAICFGWIDSVAHKRNEESKYQFFAQRKPKSNWSKANRERANKMIAQGQMTESGQKLIDLAKKIGTWEALVDVQNSVIPGDLQKQLNKNKAALKNFLAFPPSSKRIILEWILNAKKEETRQKRIDETVRLASENIKANHYRQ